MSDHFGMSVTLFDVFIQVILPIVYLIVITLVTSRGYHVLLHTMAFSYPFLSGLPVFCSFCLAISRIYHRTGHNCCVAIFTPVFGNVGKVILYV
jgi:hypothetical protein